MAQVRGKTRQHHCHVQARGPLAELDSLASSHQLERKVKQTAAVRPLSLPRGKARVKPGRVCSVAGWGQVALGTYSDTLQEVKLTIQKDQKCELYLHNYYNNAIQLCVGDPKENKASFKVRMTTYLAWLWGDTCL